MEHWAKRLFDGFEKDGLLAELQARTSRSCRFCCFYLIHSRYPFRVYLTLCCTCKAKYHYRRLYISRKITLTFGLDLCGGTQCRSHKARWMDRWIDALMVSNVPSPCYKINKMGNGVLAVLYGLDLDKVVLAVS